MNENQIYDLFFEGKGKRIKWYNVGFATWFPMKIKDIVFVMIIAVIGMMFFKWIGLYPF